jgi:hypothetical protein
MATHVIEVHRHFHGIGFKLRNRVTETIESSSILIYLVLAQSIYTQVPAGTENNYNNVNNSAIRNNIIFLNALAYQA